MTVGENLGVEVSADDDIRRATMRRGEMARLAKSSWGLKLGTFRSIHSALITRLGQYGLTTPGVFAYNSSLHRLKIQYAAVAARRIAGASRAARLGILRPLADTLLVRNLYSTVCRNGSPILGGHRLFALA